MCSDWGESAYQCSMLTSATCLSIINEKEMKEQREMEEKEESRCEKMRSKRKQKKKH